jgi:putative tryptophan/tyrosine transport system substrate-binding protein
MRRREFIAGLGGVAAMVPLAARAQQPAMPVIGFFSAGSPSKRPWPKEVASFRQGLQDTGFTEGQNLTIEYRWAEEKYDRLPALAADLIQRRVAVIATTPRATEAAMALTSTIPIVFEAGSDPVTTGWVPNLNRPGGNLTGVTLLAADLTQKRFQLLHDVVPQAGVIGVLFDSGAPRPPPLEMLQAAALSIGVPIRVVSAGTDSELEDAFAALARDRVRALFLVNSFFFFSRSERLSELAARHQISMSAESVIFPEAGALMSYGASTADAFRQQGRYTGRILKGEKPGDLPIQLPTKFEFIINLKTAKALGITIPETLLATADEVIQ